MAASRMPLSGQEPRRQRRAGDLVRWRLRHRSRPVCHRGHQSCTPRWQFGQGPWALRRKQHAVPPQFGFRRGRGGVPRRSRYRAQRGPARQL